MKTISTVTLLLFCAISFAQTSVISSKSHAGTSIDILEEPDNFGWVEPDPEFDTVIKLDEKCMIVKGVRWRGQRFSDSICDHWQFRDSEITHRKLKDLYGSNIVIIDYTKKVKPGGGDSFWINDTINRNGNGVWVLLLLLSIGGYIVFPIFKKRIS